MIRHVVMFKFKPEVDKAARIDLMQRVRKLPQEIDFIRVLTVAENVVQSPRACDFILMVDLDDETALHAYAEHPKHQPVRQISGELCSGTYVVDYVVS
jgi:hypothetical protein